MKIKILIIVLLLTIFCTSCAPKMAVPAATPTATVLPTAIPTLTPTPTPEALADAPDLTMWVDDYVHAYGGKVTVNSLEMNAEQLTDAIRKDSGAYTQAKVIGGAEYSFLIINKVPLAIFRQADGRWQRIHFKDIVEFPGGLDLIGAEARIEGHITGPGNFFDELNQGTVDVVWSVIEPEKGRFDFATFDQQVAEQTKHGLPVRSQSLVYVTQTWARPDWLANGTFTKDELEAVMTNYITTVIKHGKEMGVTEWVVANEPYIARDRESDVFYKVYGGYDYMDVAFKTARLADPDAILIYNDTNNQAANTPTTLLTEKIVNRLKTESVTGVDGITRPVIDAVGIQGHIGDWVQVPDPADVEKTLKSYGLPVIVTEFDYNLVKAQGSETEKLKQQAEVYANFLQAAINAGCKEFSFWSMYDTNNWLTDQGISNGNPGLFDMQGKPKPDYYAVLQVLYANIP